MGCSERNGDQASGHEDRELEGHIISSYGIV